MRQLSDIYMEKTTIYLEEGIVMTLATERTCYDAIYSESCFDTSYREELF